MGKPKFQNLVSLTERAGRYAALTFKASAERENRREEGAVDIRKIEQRFGRSPTFSKRRNMAAVIMAADQKQVIRLLALTTGVQCAIALN